MGTFFIFPFSNHDMVAVGVKAWRAMALFP